MNNSKDKDLIKYLAAAGILGLSYWLIHYLSKKKKSATTPLNLEKTQKILQEIKYQILTTCISSVDAFKTKPKTQVSQKDLQIYFRTEMSKIYQMREQTILKKYIVSKDEYSASLQTHKKDEKIRNGTNQILDMLEKTIKGMLPDLTVPAQAKRVLSDKQISAVYYEMCELIAIKVWQKLDQSKRNNPGFNSKDNVHFSTAIRELSIYDIKVDYLQKKGFQKKWGCPNEVFYKVMQNVKQSNKEFKTQIVAIEKAYEYAIQRITNEPDHLDSQRIKFLFNQKLHQKNPAVNKPSQPEPQPNPVRTFAAPKSVSKPTPVKKDDDQFDLDKLMMQQLMSRSQQQPKIEKPSVVKEQQKVQPKIQQKAEPLQAKVEPSRIADIQEQKPIEKTEEKVVNLVPDIRPVEIQYRQPVEVIASEPEEVRPEQPAEVISAPQEQVNPRQNLIQAINVQVKVDIAHEVNVQPPNQVIEPEVHKQAEGHQHNNLENQPEKIEEQAPQVVAPEVLQAVQVEQKKQE